MGRKLSTIWTLAALALLAVAASGCCCEDECRERYDLVARSPYVPPPGTPIIIIGPGPSGPGGGGTTPEPEYVNFYSESELLAYDGSIFDETDPDRYCKLHQDMIGRRALEFRFIDAAGNRVDGAEMVTLQRTLDNGRTRLLEIALTSAGTLSWVLTEFDATYKMVCVIGPSKLETLTVPEELKNFTLEDMTLRTKDGQEFSGLGVELQVERLGGI